ncbi:0e052663-f44a-4f1a-bf7c-cefe51b74c12 [Thermothielavioides terrestris]
MDIDR